MAIEILRPKRTTGAVRVPRRFYVVGTKAPNEQPLAMLRTTVSTPTGDQHYHCGSSTVLPIFNPKSHLNADNSWFRVFTIDARLPRDTVLTLTVTDAADASAPMRVIHSLPIQLDLRLVRASGLGTRTIGGHGPIRVLAVGAPEENEQIAVNGDYLAYGTLPDNNSEVDIMGTGFDDSDATTPRVTPDVVSIGSQGDWFAYFYSLNALTPTQHGQFLATYTPNNESDVVNVRLV